MAAAATAAAAVEPMVVMGRIAGSFGVMGWVKVFPYTEQVDGLIDFPVWWLGNEGDGEWREVKVTECNVHGKMLVASLEQCADRTAALKLKGTQIAIPRSRLPKLPKSGKDGHYWADLIGLEVINLQDEALGKVTGLLETGANDVLEVQAGAAKRLIPFVAHVIVKVDLQAGLMRVDWGLDY